MSKALTPLAVELAEARTNAKFWKERAQFLVAQVKEQKLDAKLAKSKAKADAWRKALPKLVILNATKFVVCPEIRRGRATITCTGTKDSISCDLCVRGLANEIGRAHV